MSRISCFILMTTAVILGILTGIAEATVWMFRLIPHLRDIVPYAAADALLIVGITAIIALFYRNSIRTNDDCHEICRLLGCLISYVRIIMISAAVFLVFVQILVGTAFPLFIRIPLAFLGSTSFWVMLLTFVSFVIWIARRR